MLINKFQRSTRTLEKHHNIWLSIPPGLQIHPHKQEIQMIINVIPVHQPGQSEAGSQRGLWSTSTRWHCRISSGTRHRSRRPVWSVCSRGFPAVSWCALGIGPTEDKHRRFAPWVFDRFNAHLYFFFFLHIAWDYITVSSFPHVVTAFQYYMQYP